MGQGRGKVSKKQAAEALKLSAVSASASAEEMAAVLKDEFDAPKTRAYYRRQVRLTPTLTLTLSLGHAEPRR